MSEAHEVLTAAEAAQILRCSRATIIARIHAGALSGWREGGSIGWLTTRQAVQDYIESRHVTGAGRTPARSNRSAAARKSAATRNNK